MSVEFCVVSIGALSHNRLWGETAAVRTSHATTTYIADGQRRILVDPSLPAAVLAARLGERTGVNLKDITDVFCTTVRPVHRRSIEAMPTARWWAGQQELDCFGRYLEQATDSADRLSSEGAAAARAELKLLDRFSPAPDKFTEQISLFPLPGPSDGSAGLLLTPPQTTVVIAGDAALTAEHVSRGQVWRGSADLEKALASLQELLEIADIIIPGHDNLMVTPRQRWF